MNNENSYTRVVESVKEQIDYDRLLSDGKINARILDCVVTLIADVYMSREPETFIGRERRSMELVKARFSSLTSEHIKYVLRCLDGTGSVVRNIPQYMRAALFNAPATMELYYGRDAF